MQTFTFTIEKEKQFQETDMRAAIELARAYADENDYRLIIVSDGQTEEYLDRCCNCGKYLIESDTAGQLLDDDLITMRSFPQTGILCSSCVDQFPGHAIQEFNED